MKGDRKKPEEKRELTEEEKETKKNARKHTDYLNHCIKNIRIEMKEAKTSEEIKEMVDDTIHFLKGAPSPALLWKLSHAMDMHREELRRAHEQHPIFFISLFNAFAAYLREWKARAPSCKKTNHEAEELMFFCQRIGALETIRKAWAPSEGEESPDDFISTLATSWTPPPKNDQP